MSEQPQWVKDLTAAIKQGESEGEVWPWFATMHDPAVSPVEPPTQPPTQPPQYEFANDFYIRPDGDNTANGRSWENAWKTLAKAADMGTGHEASNGHGGDGPHATKIAEQIIYNGHTFSLSKKGKPRGQLSSFGSKNVKGFHELREKILANAWKDTWDLLEPRQEQIEAVADLLVEKKTVNGRAIHETLEAMG